MWQTNLRILLVVMVTLGLYTVVANYIPQVASEVPEELTFTGEVDINQLIAAGEELFEGAGGCTACHGTGTRAPNLLTDHAGQGAIGQRCGARVPGQDCKTYLHQSMVDPNAYVVGGFEPIMPDASRTMSDTQIWALVAYMEAQGGEVTVTADDVQSTYGDAEGAPAGGAATPGEVAGAQVGAPGGLEPVALLENNLCLNCHTLGDRGVALGPRFDGMGTRLDAARIRRKILSPSEEPPAEGYEALHGVMPGTFGQQFSAAQLEVLVEYLANLR